MRCLYLSPFPLYLTLFGYYIFYICKCFYYTRFAFVLESYFAVCIFSLTLTQWNKSTSSVLLFDHNLSVSNGIPHPIMCVDLCMGYVQPFESWVTSKSSVAVVEDDVVDL